MKIIIPFFVIFISTLPVYSSEPAVYYCEMKKKISISGDGDVQKYKLTKFKFKDQKIKEYGKGLIHLGKGLGF